MQPTPEPIQPGDRVLVTDVVGKTHRAKALTGVAPGRDFPVVWVVFDDMDATGRPWPADAVEVDCDYA